MKNNNRARLELRLILSEFNLPANYWVRNGVGLDKIARVLKFTKLNKVECWNFWQFSETGAKLICDHSEKGYLDIIEHIFRQFIIFKWPKFVPIFHLLVHFRLTPLHIRWIFLYKPIVCCQPKNLLTKSLILHKFIGWPK